MKNIRNAGFVPLLRRGSVWFPDGVKGCAKCTQKLTGLCQTMGPRGVLECDSHGP